MERDHLANNMHKSLDNLLIKRGISNLDELNDEERKQFDVWNTVLTKKELTVTDIKEFCKTQCDVIQNKWADYNVDQAKKAELLPYFTVYQALLAALSSQRVAREALANQINELTK